MGTSIRNCRLGHTDIGLFSYCRGSFLMNIWAAYYGRYASYALQHAATRCNTLQHTATHCNKLRHTATHCNILLHTEYDSNHMQALCSTPLCRQLARLHFMCMRCTHISILYVCDIHICLYFMYVIFIYNHVIYMMDLLHVSEIHICLYLMHVTYMYV